VWISFVLLMGMVLMTTVSGCCSKPENTGMVSSLSDDLSDEALRTYVVYLRAVNAGTEQPESEIPPDCWTGRIKALKPLKVYVHRGNIVVVQEFADGTEKGKYIYIPVSSYLPRSGDDGFEFTPNSGKGNIYNFKRGRSK
jgi:hypothetical protein